MLVNKPETFDVIMRRLNHADTKWVAVDTETSGLDWKTNHIIGWVLTFGPGPYDTFYIPVRHAPGGNIPGDCLIPQTDDGWDGSLHWVEPQIIAGLAGKQLIFHNGAFDMKFMHRVGWRTDGNSQMVDTMIGAYLIDELRRSLSLDACCKDFNVQAKKGQELYDYIAEETGCAATKDAMGNLWRVRGDVPVVYEYGEGDGTSTYQLWHAITPELSKVYYENAAGKYTLTKIAITEFKLMPVLHRMSMRGVRVDEELLDSIVTQFESDYKDAMLGLGDLNVRSPLQMVKYFESHGVTDWPVSAKVGRPSFPESWLLTTEPGRVIVKARKYRTLLDNFLIPIKTKHIYNGKAHTDFHQTRDENYGTRTGRLSTTAPNLGAMPGKRQAALGKLFRTIFIPDEGMEFTEGDYNVCEIRICTSYCKAKAWVDGFKKGLDAHTAVAQSIEIERIFAKRINLAIMTGAGKHKIAAELGLPVNEGLAIVDQYFMGLPELKKFQKRSADIFASRGFVSTLGGRRLHLADRSKSYTAVNRLTQGGNADMVKAAMVEIEKQEGSELLLTVYDSALVQHEKGDAGARDRMLNAMVNMDGLNIPLQVPMVVDYGYGPNWGEAAFSEVGKVEWKPEKW